jgi:uncharacterized damage-inducible protein DinB
MKLTELLLAELESEAKKSRKALEQVPDGKHDWKPHDRSMAFGYLADMIANIPTWVTMIVKQDELDIKPAGGPPPRQPLTNAASHLAALDAAMEGARAALIGTTDAHLETDWKLLAGGHPVQTMSRHLMIRDTINHWVHHRGQMTVYLRLMGQKVPSMYGPSADDPSFG